jgi:hypothetical protein
LGGQKIVEQIYICDIIEYFSFQQFTIETRKLLNKKTSKEVEEINNAKTKLSMVVIIHKAI